MTHKSSVYYPVQKQSSRQNQNVYGKRYAGLLGYHNKEVFGIHLDKSVNKRCKRASGNLHSLPPAKVSADLIVDFIRATTRRLDKFAGQSAGSFVNPEDTGNAVI